jgi:hypothetical protein
MPSRRSSCWPTRRKPFLQGLSQPLVCIVLTACQADLRRDRFIHGRRTRHPVDGHKGFERFLGPIRLAMNSDDIALLSQPCANRLRQGPAQSSLKCVVRTPNPGFEFWVDDDSFGAALPHQEQLGIQLCLDVECGPTRWRAAAFEIEDEQRVAELPPLVAQHFGSRGSGAAVSAGMNTKVKRDRPNAKCFRPWQRTTKREVNVLVSSQNNQVPHIHRQLRMPAAKSTPRSGWPRFHSFNAGCALPATTSAAPLWSFAKQSTSRASSMFSATGLCVAMSTCPL